MISYSESPGKGEHGLPTRILQFTNLEVVACLASFLPPCSFAADLLAHTGADARTDAAANAAALAGSLLVAVSSPNVAAVGAAL